MAGKWTAERVLKIQKLINECYNIESLDQPISTENSFDEIHVGDFVADTMHIDEDVDRNIAKEILLDCISELRPRDASVLILRYGLKDDEPKTLEEIGQMYNVVRERIRQIEAKALKELKKIMIRRGITKYNDVL